MAISGAYLTLQVSGSVIAETTSVNIRIVSAAIEATSKDSGLQAEFIAGLVKIGIAGTFLVATDSANWTSLFTYKNAGTTLSITIFVNGTEILDGTGILKKLSITGGNSDTLITGGYGIQLENTDETIISLTTELEELLITESEEVLIME